MLNEVQFLTQGLRRNPWEGETTAVVRTRKKRNQMRNQVIVTVQRKTSPPSHLDNPPAHASPPCALDQHHSVHVRWYLMSSMRRSSRNALVLLRSSISAAIFMPWLWPSSSLALSLPFSSSQSCCAAAWASSALRDGSAGKFSRQLVSAWAQGRMSGSF